MFEDDLHIDVRKLFLTAPVFLRGVSRLGDLFEAELPEIAFAGRSNVGKSSLINALFNRKDVARTSHTPGRTQQLNFFQVRDRFILVDLPGYGYAQAPKQTIASWNHVLRLYLKGRPSLKRVYILVDSRHGLKTNDVEMMTSLDQVAVPYQVILTKTDQVKALPLKETVEKVTQFLQKHPAAHPHVLMTSARDKTGLEEVRQALYAQSCFKDISFSDHE